LAVLPSIDIELSFLEKILGQKQLKGRLNFLINQGWLIYNQNSYKLHQIIKEHILSNHTPLFKEIEVMVDSLSRVIGNSADAQIAVNNRDNIVYFESLANLLEKLESENEKVGTFFNNFGLIHYHLGAYEKAEPLYLKALKIHQKVLGDEHPSTATSYNNLAVFYYGQGDFERTYGFMKKAVDVLSKVLPSNHPHLISSKKNLKIIEGRL